MIIPNIDLPYSAVIHALQDRRFAEANALLAQIGLTVDRDPRAPRLLKTAPHGITNLCFICGLHRSGTTLAQDYLAKHYDVAFIQRTRVPENEGQFLQDVYPSERPFGGPGLFAFYPQMHPAPEPDRDRAARLADRLLSTWAAYSSDPGHSRLLEKSPPNLTRIAWLRSLFPEARFVIWTRDPRATALSTAKWHNIPVNTLMQHWNCAHLAAIQALQDDCMIVRYEDFCADPATVTQSMADFCGIARRTVPLDPATRFQTVANTNQPYLDSFPAQFATRAKLRAWELLGYHIPG